MSNINKTAMGRELNIFALRLTNLMGIKNYTQQALADLVNVKRQTISQYLAGYTFPTLPVLLSLAKHLDTSLDYLCGLK